MIQITITYTCHRCGSKDIAPNGTNKCGNAQYHCNDCGAYRVLEPKSPYSEADKQTILTTYLERASLRGLERIFGVSRQTVSKWIRAMVSHLPPLNSTVAPAQPGDIVELDEIWSFVGKKREKRWLWVALCKRTRQVVAFVIGDRSQETCLRLWRKIPKAYKTCVTFSDRWQAYQDVFPADTHHSVPKQAGKTSHIERWNNTLRQRVGRYVRSTLSFSKSDVFHHMVTKWFIIDYNQNLSLTI
mgnify:CR=1 FL=1